MTKVLLLNDKVAFLWLTTNIIQNAILSNKSAFLMINTIQNAIFNDKSGIQKFASYFERQDTIQNAVFVIKNAVFNDKKCI